MNKGRVSNIKTKAQSFRVGKHGEIEGIIKDLITWSASYVNEGLMLESVDGPYKKDDGSIVYLIDWINPKEISQSIHKKTIENIRELKGNKK